MSVCRAHRVTTASGDTRSPIYHSDETRSANKRDILGWIVADVPVHASAPPDPRGGKWAKRKRDLVVRGLNANNAFDKQWGPGVRLHERGATKRRPTSGLK
jgi:hypothetical protein